MRGYVFISLILMGWAFYELSGGDDFVPASQMAARAAEPTSQMAPVDSTAGAEVAARAAISPAVVDLNIAKASAAPSDAVRAEPAVARMVDAAPVPARDVRRNIGEGTLRVVALDRTDEATARAAVQSAISSSSTQSAVVATGDYRTVSGNSVNMRNGPGTSYSVLGRLGRGDRVEVLSDTGNGWVKLRSEETGRVGWMADFLLSSNG